MTPPRRRVLPDPRALLLSVARWPVESQHRARRNALVASTELTARRREREDVEGFLARRAQAGTTDVRRSG